LIAEAVENAKKSDVAIIFGGLNHDYDTESFDKKDMFLPYAQSELINEVCKVNPNTILVIIAGSPVDLSKVDKQVKTIVWAGYGGMEAGNAVVDCLFGKVNPSGKLPFTIPVKLEDSPAHALNAFPGVNAQVEYKEDILVGYRWFDTKNIRPLYSFGHGLSYTTFEMKSMSVDKKKLSKDDSVTVRVNVTNKGALEGAEVVQLYVSKKDSKVFRAKKELKDFHKCSLKPSQTKTVDFRIPVSDLAYYNEQLGAWTVEPGKYSIQLGSASDKIYLTQEIEVIL
ncbi:MAG: glycoside hydrolase family 3 C-terminal domain-containing protein, partial [Bacteroidales bacterium]